MQAAGGAAASGGRGAAYGRVPTGDADPFNRGGQFALDYAIQGGTGDLAGASGFGLSFLTVDPDGTPDNYQEIGLLAFAVPEPGTLPMMAGALGLLVLLNWRRRRAPAVWR